MRRRARRPFPQVARSRVRAGIGRRYPSRGVCAQTWRPPACDREELGEGGGDPRGRKVRRPRATWCILESLPKETGLPRRLDSALILLRKSRGGRKSLNWELVGWGALGAYGHPAEWPSLQSAPLQLGPREQSVSVCARCCLSVCVCSRVRVCWTRGIPNFPRFEHAPAPGWAMGRRRQSPLDFILSPARPGQFRPGAGHLEPGAASSPSQPTKGRPRALKPGAPVPGVTPGRPSLALRGSGTWGHGRPRQSPSPGVGEQEGLQVGKGVISNFFLRGVSWSLARVDAYSLESYRPWNPLCPCLFHSTISQPEAQAIRGGGASPSVSLSPSKWARAAAG